MYLSDRGGKGKQWWRTTVEPLSYFLSPSTHAQYDDQEADEVSFALLVV